MTYTVDHFVLGAPDLKLGCEYVADILGTRPVFGGVHPGRATQNALLSLDNGAYLEVLAPSDEKVDSAPLSEKLKELKDPGLVTWALRATDLHKTANIAREMPSSLEIIGPSLFRRQTAEGETLEWELLFLDKHAHGGLVPFFIDWKGSMHPSEAAPLGGVFLDVEICTPNADKLNHFFDQIGVSQQAKPSDAASLQVTLENKRGKITLNGFKESIDAWVI